MSEKLKRPEWFPWDDDPTNENGWYGRHEAEAYFTILENRISSLESALRKAREIFISDEKHHYWKMGKEYLVTEAKLLEKVEFIDAALGAALGASREGAFEKARDSAAYNYGEANSDYVHNIKIDLAFSNGADWGRDFTLHHDPRILKLVEALNERK